MRKDLKYFVVCSAIALLILSGCHTFYPYGYWQDQRMLQNNPYGVQPPQGAYITPPGQVQPGTNLGQPGTLDGSGTSTRGIDPAFNRSTDRSDQIQGIDSSGDASLNKPIPKYPDPTDNQSSTKDQGNPGNSSEDPGSPFGDGNTENNQSSTSNGVKFAEFSSPEKDGFQSPVKTTGQNENTSSGPEFAAEATPNPYDHDAKNYSWLRGKVSYEKKGKTWHIIYSLNPDPQDKFGGDLTLLGVPKNLKLEDGDVALVEGFVDQENRDARGKPIYRIHKIFGPLAPQAHFAKNERIQAQMND